MSSEVTPFAKTGGLADVSAALPRYLGASGHDVRVVMPLYARVRDGGYELAAVTRLADVPLPFGGGELHARVLSGQLPKSEVRVYFVDVPGLYDREHLYGDDDMEALRFATLSRAALSVCQWLQWAPDVVHCNDWHTGLVPLYLRAVYGWDRLFENTRSVLTLHNLGYQGHFPSSVIGALGLEDVRHLFPGGGQGASVSFLETGILYADALTTVSRTYAQEIRTSELGMGLEQRLEARRDALFGIVNGVDYGEWDPETDTLIPQTYGSHTLAKKKVNRDALLREFGLDGQPHGPVFGIVSRLTAQKGFELLPDALPPLLHGHDVRLCVVGSGAQKHEDYFHWLAQTFPGKVGFFCGYDNRRSHLVEAGSDVFVMPSRYEPCGLNQMYSLKYGTAPLVRKTGGLADTVRPFDPETGNGTGFVFDDFDANALYSAIRTVLATWQNPAAWETMLRNGMAEDWSWKRAGQQYVDLYRAVALRSR